MYKMYELGETIKSESRIRDESSAQRDILLAYCRYILRVKVDSRTTTMAELREIAASARVGESMESDVGSTMEGD
jgi:hypothetical protein